MSDLQQQIDKFFQDNDRGYPRDPRKLAYKKLQKNTQGMDREQLEAFIEANLFIPHSQYKMALGNFIQFLRKQDNMNKLNEVEQFKKLAGLLKEDDYSEDPSSNMDDESQSGDTDAMGGIDEADDVKSITIEVPSDSYASDFGKAVARELVHSYGAREAKSFMEAFVAEIKKFSGS
jgi:hypothetical protein